MNTHSKPFSTPNGDVDDEQRLDEFTAKVIAAGDKKLQAQIERQNLTMRMGMRRFTRLTNGFSKKLKNHGHAIALYFMYYNFGRIHQTIRVTPAMEAGLSDHV